MFTARVADNLPKSEFYTQLISQLQSLIGGEVDPVANMANCAALLFHSLPDLNWTGFYLRRGEELVLGPFQGRPACIRLPLGRGVCGKAASERRAVRVPDVSQFDDHIACDAASRSEIVLPLYSRATNEIIGVLDLDSPSLNRFDEKDERGLRSIADLIAAKL
jgi:GAF domain-containing protein